VRHHRTNAVGALLEACPNVHVDPSARMAELGRQPYTARAFFLRWQDRILFGSDAAPSLAAWRRWWRFLETWDEDFPYDPDGPPGQGRWNVCGLGLPDGVLRKVYRDNARRVVFREGPGETAGADRPAARSGPGDEHERRRSIE